MSKEIIVKRAAKEVKDGMYINLGIGIPTLIADEIEKMGLEVFFTIRKWTFGYRGISYDR